MTKKFKCVAAAAALLWAVVLIQIIVTRFFVSHTDFTQAFARNSVSVSSSQEASADSKNEKQGNVCTEGVVAGKLSRDQQEALAEDLFNSMGGGTVLSGRSTFGSDYFVAYGYTNGIKKVKKINGKNINMTVAISYDETEDVTRVVMGTPLVNSDF